MSCQRCDQLALFPVPLELPAGGIGTTCRVCVDEIRELDQCAYCGLSMLEDGFVMVDGRGLPECPDCAHESYMREESRRLEGRFAAAVSS